MKRISHTVFYISVAVALAATAFFFFSAKTGSVADEPVSSRAVEAGSAAGHTRTAAELSSNTASTSSIPLEDNETLLDLYAFNLDYDDEEEQILVIRESDDPAGIVKVVLADYSPLSKKWSRTWKGSTLVTKNKTFQVSVSDLIGDHNLNIICTGMNDANEQTMTVYWKSEDQGQGRGMTFVKVFEQAGSTVIIESSERPDSYKLGQSNAESWPVSVWKADASSGNYLDQIRELWRWSFYDKAYLLVSTERIPGASIARKMAESILDGKAETFKAFLDGTWYRETLDPLSSNALFITFQSRDESVLFSGDGLIEVYGWENSNPTRYGLYIASRNQAVQNLRRLMDIELASADSINVRVFQDYRIKADISGKWDGRYRRLSQDMATAFKKQPSMASPSPVDLSGVYDSDEGVKLVLDGTAYSVESAAWRERGSFTLFELAGTMVMDMRTAQPDAAGVKRRTWLVETSSRYNRDGSTTQILSLKEARLGISGIEPSQNPPVTYKKR